MEYIKLCEVISSAKTERCGASDYPVLSITKSDGVVLQSDKFKKRIASTDTEQYKLVKRGQLVQGIHIDEANFGIQSIVDIGIVSPAYKIWDVDFQKIVPKYIETVLRSPRSVRYYSSKFNGSVKRRERITDSDFLAMEIPFPSKEQQQYAVDVLEKVCSMTTLYQQQLQKLDELVKARFVEMFDNGNYLIEKLGAVCKKITDGTHKTPTYLDEGITFISAKNIVNGELDFTDIKHISESEYQEIQKRCQTAIYDILLSKSGSLGSPVIVKTEEKLGLFESLAILKYDREKLIPEFLCEQLKTDRIQRQFTTGTKGVAIKHLHLGVIADTDIIVPSLDEQKIFANFVHQVNKSKAAIQKALDETQLLFDSLMQKYFG